MSERDGPAGSLDPRLAAGLRRLAEQGMEPPRDLWPDLERQLRGAQRSPHGAIEVFAAAAALIVALLAAGAWWAARPPDPVALESIRAAAVPPESSAALRRAHARYVEERRRVLDSIAVALADYPPESRDEIRQSIHEIERAIDGIEQTLASRPPGIAAETRRAELFALELRLLRLVDDRLRSDGRLPRGGLG